MADEDASPIGPARPPIAVRRLRLLGVTRNYEVDFRRHHDETVCSLSIIAGEISTGKTTVLEFVAYCLGASKHPTHPEVLRQVRAAQLEIELSGTVHVVERSVGQPSKDARVWRATLEAVEHGMGGPVERRTIDPPGAPESVSSLLLSHCDLEGIRLREAPTNAEAKTDPLSFRDLMWLCYMQNERLDDKNLLFEKTYMKEIKLRQVVDVVFGTYDGASVELGQRVQDLGLTVSRARAELEAAKSVVDEQALAPKKKLQSQIAEDRARIEVVTRQLGDLDARIRAHTEYATDARARHADAAAHARHSANAVRERETLLQRLVPLRAQYAEDVRKLHFLVEARTLFDPVRVTVCPACQTRLPHEVEPNDGRCGLCGTPLPERGLPAPESQSDAQDGGAAASDVRGELRATEARLRELFNYTDSLESELLRLRVARAEADAKERESAEDLDRLTAVAVSPYLAERDGLMVRRSRVHGDIEAAEAALRLYAGLERRAANLALHEQNLEAARRRLKTLATASDRESVVSALSDRFGRILDDFHYPKLEKPTVSPSLVPSVRGSRYDEASSGGRTLLSLAWVLCIFEVSWEQGGRHPGFLLLDSPQKNLGSHTSGEADEFADAAIVHGIYGHLENWLADRGRGAQMIIVDNTPPTSVESAVIVRFTRDPDRPPYGLITDETG